jgi:hypothetical protein
VSRILAPVDCWRLVALVRVLVLHFYAKHRRLKRRVLKALSTTRRQH